MADATTDSLLPQVERGLAELLDREVRYGLAFSGGCDSMLLLALLTRAGFDVAPYTLVTAFQAPFELDDARDGAAFAGTPLTVIQADVLADRRICANPPDRCYWCKRFIFGRILDAMATDGRTVLLDGSNASDDPARRPGMRVLGELGVRSPLRELGLAKPQVRALSRELGLFTAEKPNFSCYATKVPAGQPITREALELVAARENRGWR